MVRQTVDQLRDPDLFIEWEVARSAVLGPAEPNE